MNECVLVVDDDREIVKAIAILLEKEGYQVCRAYDGLQALDVLMSREVHLILMDIMMPKLDGLSALMKIREQKNLPVIVLSAKGEETDKILGLSMGADDYIAKPYLPQELVARVRSQLRRYMNLGRQAGKRKAVLQQAGKDPVCGRRAGEADGHGNKNHGAVHGKSGPGLSRRGDLQPCLGRGSLFSGKYGDGAHPAHPGKNRDQLQGTGIYKGGVGNWIQNGKEVKK